MRADRYVCPSSGVWFLGLVIALLASNGCSLLLDFGDSSGSDASVLDAFFGSKCGADEPNDTLATRVDIDLPTATVDASICASTGPDFYMYRAPGAQSVTITAEYKGSGELGLRFHDPTQASQETVIKNTVGSNGMAVLQLLGNETVDQEYAIEIFAASSGVEADYTLTVKEGSQ